MSSFSKEPAGLQSQQSVRARGIKQPAVACPTAGPPPAALRVKKLLQNLLDFVTHMCHHGGVQK